MRSESKKDLRLKLRKRNVKSRDSRRKKRDKSVSKSASNRS